MGNVSAAMKAYNRAGRVYGESCDLLAKTGSVKSELELHTHGEDALFRLSLWSRSNS
jgi:cytochrome c-type biogenesis protein CcmH/NrfG